MFRRKFLAIMPSFVALKVAEKQLLPPIQIAEMVTDFQTGRIISSANPSELRPAGSIIKLLIAVSLFESKRSAPMGKKLSMVVPASAFRASSEAWPGVRVGSHILCSTLILRMIESSDNFAANVLIENIGLPAINQTALEIGLGGTHLHGPFVTSVKRVPPRAFTTAQDCNRLLEVIVAGSRSKHNPARSQFFRALLETMTRQNDRRFLRPAMLGNILVADKTGELHGEINECAVINPFGKNPLLLSVLARGAFDVYADSRVYHDAVLTIKEKIAGVYLNSGYKPIQ